MPKLKPWSGMLSGKWDDNGNMPKPETISLDELVKRCERAAQSMAKRNPHRLLLLNAVLALQSLGHRLQEAWEERDTLREQLRAEGDEKKTTIVLPGGYGRVN